MAISYDNSSVGQTGTNGTSLSFSHTCSTSSDRLLVVVAGGQIGRDITDVQYNSVSLYHAITGAEDIELWWMIAPATGGNTVTVTWGQTEADRAAIAVSYTGVAQTSTLDQIGSFEDTATTWSTTLNLSEANEVIVTGIGSRSGVPEFFGADGVTRRNQELTQPLMNVAIGDEIGVGSGNETSTWTTSAGEGCDMVSASFSNYSNYIDI